MCLSHYTTTYQATHSLSIPSYISNTSIISDPSIFFWVITQTRLVARERDPFSRISFMSKLLFIQVFKQRVTQVCMHPCSPSQNSIDARMIYVSFWCNPSQVLGADLLVLCTPDLVGGKASMGDFQQCIQSSCSVLLHLIICSLL